MSYEIAQQRLAAARRTSSPRLNLSQLGLTAQPPALCDLSELRVLWLSENQLTAWPPEFGRLTKLKGNGLTVHALPC